MTKTLTIVGDKGVIYSEIGLHPMSTMSMFGEPQKRVTVWTPDGEYDIALGDNHTAILAPSLRDDEKEK